MATPSKPTVIAQPEKLRDGSDNPNAGLVITPSTNNPEWGTFRVDSVTPTFSNGVLNMNKRTAFVRGRIADLQAYGLTAGMQLSGKIVKEESFSPLYERQTAKVYPPNTTINGRDVSGQSVLTDGRETYMQYVYTEDPRAQDAWIGEDAIEVSEELSQALSQQEI